MNYYRPDIEHKKIKKPAAAHFNQRNHNVQHMRVMLIDVLRRVNPLPRKLRESKWITTLSHLYSPRGTTFEQINCTYIMHCVLYLLYSPSSTHICQYKFTTYMCMVVPSISSSSLTPTCAHTYFSMSSSNSNLCA